MRPLILAFTLLISSVLLAYEPVTVRFNDGRGEQQVIFYSPPKRAVTTSHFMTEMLLSLGLEKSMAGTAWADNDILPELLPAYESVPVLAKRYPSKEILYSVEPDFISGWHSSLDPKRLAGTEELIAMGINPYIISSLEKGATVESVYEDYLTLGAIFDVRERALEVVETLKTSVSSAKKLRGDLEAPKVLAYDSGREAPFVVAGTGLGNDIIEKSGGENIFRDISGNYATVSWEAVLERDPDIILIVDYGNESAKEKIEFFKTNEFTRELDAVRNNRFVTTSLAGISPGPRIAGTIESLSSAFFGEKR